MTVLIDPPAWLAHGRGWSHLVSDASLAELHVFAARIGLSRRAFDVDHYDVPQERYDGCVAAGAYPVPARDLLARLDAAGLRVRQADKPVRALELRRERLLVDWRALGAELSVVGFETRAALADAISGDNPDTGWVLAGEALLRRWSQPQRRYHDTLHLDDVLASLEVLEREGARVGPAVRAAAWFHDAVYAGEPGRDEAESAALAAAVLGSFGVDAQVVAHVRALILATAPGAELPAPGGDLELDALLDADLAVFASTPKRYGAYALAVRAEYARFDDATFTAGRSAVLERYLEADPLYRTPQARGRWESMARANLAAEVGRLRAALAG